MKSDLIKWEVVYKIDTNDSFSPNYTHFVFADSYENAFKVFRESGVKANMIVNVISHGHTTKAE